MHQVLPYSDNDYQGITKRGLLVSIWRRPQATLTFILAKYPDDYVSILFFLGGIARAVERAITQQRSDMNAGAMLLLAVVMGSISGWITSSLYAWGLTIVGRWLGGMDDTNKFRTVLAWAQVPSIAGLLLLWPALVFLKDDSFQELRLAYPLLTSSVLPALFLAKVVLGSWSVVILLKGVALVQGFSVGRALANILLPGSLVVAFILLIAWQIFYCQAHWWSRLSCSLPVCCKDKSCFRSFSRQRGACVR